MSDRRAVSAGHLGASSVAANETWRVAVGGNRVESMTVDQIAQAFHAGHLNVRTPLWPPGTTGWQALGNFAEFQAPPAAYGGGQYDAPNGLAQFEEADDDPTRMWTGAGDDLPGMEAMQAPPPMEQRPSTRTGTRQVSRPVPSPPMAPPVPSRPAAPPPAQAAAAAWPAPPPAPSLASRTPALVPSSVPPRQNRGNGLMLVAGLVGLVGLGSAVLAARGNLSGSSEPAPASAEVAAEATPAAEPAAEVRVPKTEGGEAQLAKYDDTSATTTTTTTATAAPTSAFVAGSPAKAVAETPASEKPAEPAPSEKAEEKPVAEAAEPAPAPETKRHAKASEASERAESSKPEKAVKASKSRSERSEEAASKRIASRATPKRAAAELPRQKPVPAAVVEKPEKPEKIEKAEKPEKAEVSSAAAPANSAVNEAAAAALANSANLAASCRPRGGPAGAGKARVIYSNDGEVQSVEILTAKFRDTLTGSCVRMVFRRAKIPAFKGEPPTFIKSFTIPEE